MKIGVLGIPLNRGAILRFGVRVLFVPQEFRGSCGVLPDFHLLGHNDRVDPYGLASLGRAGGHRPARRRRRRGGAREKLTVRSKIDAALLHEHGDALAGNLTGNQ